MSAAPPGSRPRCAICGRPAVDHYRPFCSRRCADVDLGRWLKGVYSVPTNEPANEPTGASEAEDRGGGSDQTGHD